MKHRCRPLKKTKSVDIMSQKDYSKMTLQKYLWTYEKNRENLKQELPEIPDANPVFNKNQDILEAIQKSKMSALNKFVLKGQNEKRKKNVNQADSKNKKIAECHIDHVHNHLPSTFYVDAAQILDEEEQNGDEEHKE